MSPRDREQILSSLELSLGFPPREDALVTPAAAPFQGRWLEGGESWEPFQKEIQALSGRFHWAETLQEARSAVRTILAEHGVRRAIQWEHPFLETLGIDNLLQDAGVERIFETAGERFPRQCAQAELGITAADAVIVESIWTPFKKRNPDGSTGITVITSGSDEHAFGMTANAFSSLSPGASRWVPPA